MFYLTIEHYRVLVPGILSTPSPPSQCTCGYSPGPGVF